MPGFRGRPFRSPGLCPGRLCGRIPGSAAVTARIRNPAEELSGPDGCRFPVAAARLRKRRAQFRAQPPPDASGDVGGVRHRSTMPQEIRRSTRGGPPMRHACGVRSVDPDMPNCRNLKKNPHGSGRGRAGSRCLVPESSLSGFRRGRLLCRFAGTGRIRRRRGYTPGAVRAPSRRGPATHSRAGH